MTILQRIIFILLIINGLLLPCRGQNYIFEGVVTDTANAPLPWAHIAFEPSGGTLADSVGKFYWTDTVPSRRVQVSMLGYELKTITLYSGVPNRIVLKDAAGFICTYVVTASRYEQTLEQATVSMDVVDATLVNDKNVKDVRGVLDQVAGVQISEDQVSIRGGSGFSYGAGSRTLVLVDGMPMLTASAAQAKWDFYPTENIDQIEVIKGAASALYGSSALNGVINIRTKKPDLEPYTKIRSYQGFYHDPVRWDTLGSRLNAEGEVNKTLKWWDGVSPQYGGLDLVHLRKWKSFDVTASGAAIYNQGYKQGADLNRGRFNFRIARQDPKIKGLSYDLGTSIHKTKGHSFLLWQDADNGYIPMEGTLNSYDNWRWSVDQSTKWVQNQHVRHLLQHRIFHSSQKIPNSDSRSTLVYNEYQFLYKKDKSALTAGLSNAFGNVTGELFGDHQSNNASAYAQYDLALGKLNLSAGARAEHYTLDGDQFRSHIQYPLGRQFTDSTTVWKDTLTAATWSNVKPLFRFGANYEVNPRHFARLSAGQGFRFPSISEKFVETVQGALKIFPNPSVSPETGWNAEIGWRYKLSGNAFRGYVDLAAFWTEYDQMMEFVFGQYFPTGFNPTTIEDFVNYSGFQSQNVSQARINGFEVSTTLETQLGKVQGRLFGGYTYTNPVIIGATDSYISGLSNRESNMLKYRFNHQFKSDIGLKWKDFTLGNSVRYQSFAHNLDRSFVEPVLGTTFILPGLKKYRATYYKGELVWDLRAGYQVNKTTKLSLVINNLLNNEYMGRPGDIQAPRSSELQLIVIF